MSKKKIIISAVILILLVAAGCIAWRCRYYFIGTSSAEVQAKENKDFGIADFHSSVDKDGDGIDDQTDILQERETILPQNRFIKANIILQDILTISMESVRISWQMHCEVQAMILWNWLMRTSMHIRRIMILRSRTLTLISGE